MRLTEQQIEGIRRKFHSPEVKAKVGLEAVRGVKAIQEQASMLFEGKPGPSPVAAHRERDRLYSEIGTLKMELD